MLYNPQYLENLKPLFSNEHNDNRAKVEAVNLLMWTTGVYKLFTKEDYRNFFKRMHLITRHFNLIDRFFLNESELLPFIYKGQIYSIGVDEFANCIGLMCGTSPRVMEPLDKWLGEIQNRFNESILTGLNNQLVIFIGDIKINDVLMNGKVAQELEFKNQIRELEKADLINADILANSMVDEIMEEVFVKWKYKHPEAEEEYNKQALELKN